MVSLKSYCLVPFLYAFMSSVHAEGDFQLARGNQLKASVAAEYGFIDNFLLSHDNKESTSYFKMTPSMAMQAEFDRLLMQIEAKSEHFTYQEFSDDDHSTYRVSPNLYYKVAQNKTLYLKANAADGFESRGSGLSLGDAESIESGDKKDITGASGGYMYGSENSVAKFTINAETEKTQYSTRRAETYLLDNAKHNVNTTFDYLLSGKTYVAFDVGYTKKDYENDSTRNEEELLALIGVKWQVSEVTQVDLLLGYQEITFEESTFESDGSFKWKANFDWKPLINTKINFISERSFQETNRLDKGYRISDKYQFKLNQSFTDFFAVSADINYSQDNVFTDITEDSEDYFSTNIKLLYSRKQWLTFFVDYKYQKLQSNDVSAEYQQNQLGLGLQISM